MNKNHKRLVVANKKAYVAYKRGRSDYRGTFPMGKCEPLDNKPKVAANKAVGSTRG